MNATHLASVRGTVFVNIVGWRHCYVKSLWVARFSWQYYFLWHFLASQHHQSP